MFGRLEEEIVALRAAGIAFEIVPGISAASAAAAAAQIPLTRRLSARRVQFVTGHDVTGDLPEQRNMAALADPDATTVVFMPKRTFPALAASADRARAVARHAGADRRECRPSRPAPDAHRRSRTLAAQLAGGFSGKPALILYGPLMDPRPG